MTLAAAWTAWLDRLAAAGHDPRPGLRPPATDAAVGAALAVAPVPLPDDVRVLYRLADGQDDDPALPNLFPGHRFLPVHEAARAWTGWRDLAAREGPEGMADHAAAVVLRAGDPPVRREYWAPGWWPLALDGGGNALVVDTDPPPGGTVGQIVVTGPDEDERRVLAPGVRAYLVALAAADLVEEEVDEGVLWWDAPALR
jgi:cell wall assembly regulator SMI1